MKDRHLHFEILCTLAVAGELSPHEEIELASHARDCIQCAERMAQLTDITSQFALSEHPRGCSNRIPRGMGKRFQARAVREGVVVSRAVPSRLRRPIAAAFAALILVAVPAGYSSLMRHLHERTPRAGLHRQVLAGPVTNASPNAAETNSIAVTVAATTSGQALSKPRRPVSIKFASARRAPEFIGDFTILTGPDFAGPDLTGPNPQLSASDYRIVPFQSKNAGAFLTLASVASSRSMPGFHLAALPSTRRLDLTPFWTDSALRPSQHPAFILSARIPDPAAPGGRPFLARSFLDLDAYLPHAQHQLKLNLPQFNLWQNAAD